MTTALTCWLFFAFRLPMTSQEVAKLLVLLPLDVVNRLLALVIEKCQQVLARRFLI